VQRFTGVDPLAEKYYSISPYAYCAGNPVRYVDYDGRDYGLVFDEKNKTVTLRATYYATSSSLNSANTSVSAINSQSGNFTYTVGKGDDATTYTVNFDMKVSEVKVDPNLGELGSLTSALANDQSGEGNTYQVVADSKLGENTNGTTIDGKSVQVKDSRKSTETGAHEIGHTLGLVHNTSGLMTPASTDDARTKSMNKGDIKDMIRYPLGGKTNSESGVNAGKGTVTNNTNSTNDQLRKGKVAQP